MRRITEVMDVFKWEKRGKLAVGGRVKVKGATVVFGFVGTLTVGIWNLGGYGFQWGKMV